MSSTTVQFERACARNRVRDQDRAALYRLLESWPTTEADPLAWLMEEYRHWLLYVHSRDGDESASLSFERYWRDAARAYLGRGFTPEQVDELGALFFERVYERASAFRWATPWTAYLRTILLNVARGEIRRLRRQRARETSLELDGPHATPLHDRRPSAEERLLAGERDAHVREALKRLNASDRQLLIAFVVEQTPADTIAADLGVKRDAVYQRLKRARERLRKQIEAGAVRPAVRSGTKRHLR